MSAPSSNPGQRRRERLLKMVVPPVALVLFLLLLELALRIGGYHGASSDPYESFVLHRPLFLERAGTYRTNPARTSYFHDQSFAAAKAAGYKRVFDFGGSVTYGFRLADPRHDCYGARLPALLAERCPGTHTEVINCGGICYATDRLLGIVQECLNYQPDAMIVTTGTNEFLEPRRYAELMKEQSALCYLLSNLRTAELIRDLGVRFNRSRTTRPSEMKEPALAADDIEERYMVRDPQEIARTLAHFKDGLEQIVVCCQAQGTPLILCTCPANLRDWPPFHTEPGGGVSREQMLQHLRRANAFSEAGKPADALAVARDVLAKDDRAAVFHYVAAKSLDALGRTAEARDEYLRAKDSDAFPHRALSSFNDAVRAVARRHGVDLLDLEALFTAKSPDGIPGKNLFLDQCHPNAEGHSLVAKHLAPLLASVLYGVPRTAPCEGGSERTALVIPDKRR